MNKFYEIAPEGFVRNLRTGRVLKTDINKSGHHRVTISVDGCAERFYLHRLVAVKYVPNPESKPFVNHKDGNKDNNSFENLEWVTCQENTQHAFDMGLRHSGSKAYQAKLTEEVVINVCELLVQGLRRAEIMGVTGVSKTQFDDIRSRKSWKRISAPYIWQTFND